MDLYWTRLVVFIEYPSEATTDVQKGGKLKYELWQTMLHKEFLTKASYLMKIYPISLCISLQIKVNLMLYCLQS